MPVFAFTGKTAAGEKVSGDRVAENKQVLQAQLRRERITPTAIKEKGKEIALAMIGVRTTVEGGATLANARRGYPKIFDDLSTNMIEAGETGGILDVILQRLATYVEKAVKLKAAVKSAMVYPVAVTSIAGLIVGGLLKWVVPIFSNLFAGLGVELPLPTRIVMGLSALVGRFGWL